MLKHKNRKQIMAEMDALQHDKENGFYDKEMDWYFSDLTDWLKMKWNVGWNDIL